MTHPDPSRLAQVPIFSGLSDDELAMVADWLEVSEVDAGRAAIHSHAHGYAFFVLDDGRAHAELGGQVLEELEPGDVFGEMAFFAADSRRSAEIVADTPVRLFSMFGTRFREMQMKLPEVAARLEQLVAERRARIQDTEQPA